MDNLTTKKKVIEITDVTSEEAAQLSQAYGSAIVFSEDDKHQSHKKTTEDGTTYFVRLGDIFKNGIRYTLFKGVETENMSFDNDGIQYKSPKMVDIGNGHRLYLNFDLDSGMLSLEEFMTLKSAENTDRTSRGAYINSLFACTQDLNILSNTEETYNNSFEGFRNTIGTDSNIFTISLGFNAEGTVCLSGSTVVRNVDFIANNGLTDCELEWMAPDGRWHDVDNTNPDYHCPYISKIIGENSHIWFTIMKSYLEKDNKNQVKYLDLRLVSLYDYSQIMPFKLRVMTFPENCVLRRTELDGDRVKVYLDEFYPLDSEDNVSVVWSTNVEDLNYNGLICKGDSMMEYCRNKVDEEAGILLQDPSDTHKHHAYIRKTNPSETIVVKVSAEVYVNKEGINKTLFTLNETFEI